MATITKPFTFSAGATIVASEHNNNFDTIYNEFNGNISNVNISGSANISDTKLAAITTAGKVSGTALTGLASTPSGAGVIPSANLESETTLTDAANIATDASTATIFHVPLTTAVGATRQLDNPTNSVAGMKRVWRFVQDATSGQGITLDSDFRVAESVASLGTITLTNSASAVDYMGAVYNGTDSKWDIIAFSTKML